MTQITGGKLPPVNRWRLTHKWNWQSNQTNHLGKYITWIHTNAWLNRNKTKHNKTGRIFNSLAPGTFKFNFRWVIFKLILVKGGWGISYEIFLRLMPLDHINDKSTLVQVMAWCRQATGHYLSQRWPRSMSPNGVTRPQWVWGMCCTCRERSVQKVMLLT